MSAKFKSKSQLGSLLSNKLKVNEVNGSMVVTNRPKRELVGDPTPGQLEVQRKFLEASQYAAHQISIDEVRKEYEAGITPKKRSAFLVALSDFLKAPQITSINAAKYHGNIGDAIQVIAYDDFKVVGVKVTINGADGTKLEEGDAVQDKVLAARWNYKCTVANASTIGSKITAVAIDKPGNETSLDKVL